MRLRRYCHGFSQAGLFSLGNVSQMPQLGACSSSSVTLWPLRRNASTCLLCDRDYHSWSEHASRPEHLARTAICTMFVSPERSEAILTQLKRHIRMDFQFVDAVNAQKVDRRRRRLMSTLLHLAEEGVLRGSLPQVIDPSCALPEHDALHFLAVKDRIPCTVGEAFMNMMVLGEGFARQEVMDRVARLMPSTNALDLSSITTYVLSSRHLARMFDALYVKELIAERNYKLLPSGHPAATSSEESTSSVTSSSTCKQQLATILEERLVLTPAEKAVILLSCLGELVLYSQKERSHSVATKTAADELVLNVLGTHAMENILAELVHEVLQLVVEEGTPVWRAHTKDVSRKTFEDTMSVPPPLDRYPQKCSRSIDDQISTALRDTQLRALFCIANIDADVSLNDSRPPIVDPVHHRQQSWVDLSRSLSLEVSVSQPVNPSAVYAPMLPRLSPKKKEMRGKE